MLVVEPSALESSAMETSQGLDRRGNFISCSLSTKPRKRETNISTPPTFGIFVGLWTDRLQCAPTLWSHSGFSCACDTTTNRPTNQPTNLSCSASLACLVHPNDDFRLLTAGVYRTLFPLFLFRIFGFQKKGKECE